MAFAKRQRTWFRAEPGIAWLDATDGPADRRPPSGWPGRPSTGRSWPDDGLHYGAMPAPHLIETERVPEQAFLVAVDTGEDDGWTARTRWPSSPTSPRRPGAEVVGAEWQNRRHVDPNWYVGKGKAEELAAAKRETGFDVLVADDELSPAQQRALEELLNVKVIDRSRLILDIFALHAQTHEGRLQVELAQLEYQLPRLTRLWTHLSRTRRRDRHPRPRRDRSSRRTGGSSGRGSRR